MKDIKNLIVHKPNQLIELEGGYLTTIKYATYNFILHKLQTAGTHYINISLSEIFSTLEIAKNYDDFIQYLDELQKIRVVSKDSKGKLWGAFNLLSAFKKNEDGSFYIEVPYFIFKALCDKDTLYYTTIKLLEQKSFKCTYTGLFYEIFKKYEKINLPVFSLEELKKMTGTLEKYKDYKDFKRYVIVKSINEINNLEQSYIYLFEEEYLGRKVDKIRFTRKEKAVLEVPEENKTPEISEQLFKAIEKARKNRFVQEKYSQRAVDKAVQQFGEELVIKGLKELYKFQKPISSFSKMLVAKIDDIRKLKAVKTRGTKHQEEVKEPVKTQITASDFSENEKKTIPDYQTMISTQSAELVRSFSPKKMLNFYKELAECQSVDELKKFCDKYSIIVNLELF